MLDHQRLQGRKSTAGIINNNKAIRQHLGILGSIFTVDNKHGKYENYVMGLQDVFQIVNFYISYILFFFRLCSSKFLWVKDFNKCLLILQIFHKFHKILGVVWSIRTLNSVTASIFSFSLFFSLPGRKKTLPCGHNTSLVIPWLFLWTV